MGSELAPHPTEPAAYLASSHGECHTYLTEWLKEKYSIHTLGIIRTMASISFTWFIYIIMHLLLTA